MKALFDFHRIPTYPFPMFPPRLLPLCFAVAVMLAVNACSQHGPPSPDDRAARWFHRMDANGDGVLTADEVGRPRLFQRLDKNGDGRVTLSEARAFMRERGDAPGPGRYAGGPPAGSGGEESPGGAYRGSRSARDYTGGPEGEESSGENDSSPRGARDYPPGPAGEENRGTNGAGTDPESASFRRASFRPASASSSPGEGGVYRNIPYAKVAGVDPNLLSLDVYAPKGSAPRPVVVFIHGGGWQIGDKAHANIGENKARLFVGHNFVYVAINYRLSPAVSHPTHVRDVAKALAWVADNIGKYSGDPGRIYIMGHSSGAHLAALVATDETYLRKEGHSLNTIKGAILLDSGGLDIPRAMGGEMQERGHEFYTAAFGNNPRTWADASPSHHVSSGKGIPPMLVFYVDRPRSADSSRDFVRSLKSAGVPAASVEVHGKGHSELNSELGNSGDGTTRLILGFLGGESLSRMPSSI